MFPDVFGELYWAQAELVHGLGESGHGLRDPQSVQQLFRRLPGDRNNQTTLILVQSTRSVMMYVE